MKLPRRLTRPLTRLRHPQTTVRWRLTLLYGGLFLICGAGLLAITYTLVSDATTTNMPFNGFLITRHGPLLHGITPRRNVQERAVSLPPLFPNIPARLKRVLASKPGQAAVGSVVARQRVSDLHHLEVESGIALAIMAIISGLLGWLVAGRVLRPLRTMTVTTQEISEVNLNRRLSMPGPRDELRQLADTIDELLERLERAFAAQRQFVANASHELRTPLTAARALLEMVLSDPQATVATFRETCQHVLSENEQQEQLIDALLTLAQGQRGLDRREAVDLQALVSDEIDKHERQAVARALQVNASLDPVEVYGDRRLLGRLVSNLLENAIRYNQPGGRVQVRLEASGGQPVFRISNTGPTLTAEEIRGILQPFQRLTPDRTNLDEGLGLGLSIVAAIAGAHGAQLGLTPRFGGGLEVEVRFPAAPHRDEMSPAAAIPAGAQSGPALELTR
jgi:signal transduction histidine kinase